MSTRPLATFFVLACAITWLLAALYRVSIALPLLGLFGPAIAAIVVARATHGNAGVRDLLRRVWHWRFALRWYAFAVGVPLVLVVATWAFSHALGERAPLRFAPLTPVGIVLALLIVGEEVGWRGFALPRLLAHRSAFTASVILGVLWCAWHLPNFFIDGYPQHGLPFSAFLITTIAYSVLLTFLHLRTEGSVLAAWLLHASINTFSPAGLTPLRAAWSEAVVYGVFALVLGTFAFGFRRTISASRQHRHDREQAAAEEGMPHH